MEPPTIRIEDADSTTSLTLHYALGSNSLDTVAIAASIYSLSTHPGRARVEPDTETVTPCNASFLASFWSAAASLLDYFADFYVADAPLMQSVWFHLLDAWQAASPAALYKQTVHLGQPHKARTFTKHYEETLALFQRLLGQDPKQPDHKHASALIHNPTGIVDGKTGAYATGPFLSGLKPWHQFLSASAPGFSPASPLPSVTQHAVAHSPDTRYIPQPAIALLATHTARARRLVQQVFKTDVLDAPAHLAAFSASALEFPSTLHTEHTTHRVAYSLAQGAPPVGRHEGLADPSMLVSEPDLMLLDEAVANCRGTEAYVSMTGPVGEEGVGFDVWGVREDGLGGEVGWGGEMFAAWEVGGG